MATSAANPQRRQPSFRPQKSFWCYFAAATVVLSMAGYAWVGYLGQRAAIAAIERLGGRVALDRDVPQWLRCDMVDRWMPAFDTAGDVDLNGAPLADADLLPLEKLKTLKSLNLGN